MSTKDVMYGLVAEFDNPEDLLEAARKTRQEGYKQVQAYTPYHVEGLADLLEKRYNPLPYVIPAALFFGALLGYILQYYTSVFVYEFNIGGRPLVSWPAFLIITFETAILTAGITAVVVMFMQNGLPLPYHPIFNTPNIETAAHSHFFLCIPVEDEKFDLDATKDFLLQLEPINVSEVQS